MHAFGNPAQLTGGAARIEPAAASAGLGDRLAPGAIAAALVPRPALHDAGALAGPHLTAACPVARVPAPVPPPPGGAGPQGTGLAEC